jgi:hypothetical protein
MKPNVSWNRLGKNPTNQQKNFCAFSRECSGAVDFAVPLLQDMSARKKEAE